MKARDFVSGSLAALVESTGGTPQRARLVRIEDNPRTRREEAVIILPDSRFPEQERRVPMNQLRPDYAAVRGAWEEKQRAMERATAARRALGDRHTASRRKRWNLALDAVVAAGARAPLAFRAATGLKDRADAEAFCFAATSVSFSLEEFADVVAALGSYAPGDSPVFEAVERLTDESHTCMDCGRSTSGETPVEDSKCRDAAACAERSERGAAP